MEVTKDIKILYVITKATWGGAQRYVWDLMRASKDKGYTAILAYGEEGILSEEAKKAGFEIHRIPHLKRNLMPGSDLISFFEMKALFKKIRPDIVHVNSSKAGGIGSLAARMTKIKTIVFTIHAWAFNEKRSLFSKFFFFWSQYATLLLAHHSIATSEAIQRKTKKWPFVSKKVTTVYHGISVPTFLEPHEARTKLGISSNTMLVGTIAEMNKNKGLDIAIDAWKNARIPNASLVLIGSGEDEEKLKKQASGTPSIYFVNSFKNDAANYLRALDVFILPSRTEAFGYVLLEAGYAKLPIIASDVGGIPEIIEHKKTGILVPPQNSPLLAQQIISILEDEPKRRELGENLYKKVTTAFSKERMLKDTFSIYGI